MPSKMQFYAQMADQAGKQITGSYQSWISFLQTAGRLYSFGLRNQRSVYAAAHSFSKKWEKSFNIPEDRDSPFGDNCLLYFVNSHPAVVDGFIDEIRSGR